MTFEKAIDTCHVRSGIYRTGQTPRKVYAKNHEISLWARVPGIDQDADDWQEWDPNEEYGLSLPAE